MKRIICAALAIVMTMCIFAGCVLTEDSSYESTYEAMKGAENVVIHLYEEEEEALRVDVTDKLLSLVEGKWESASGQDGGKKVVTITVGTQHEITFFDNGRAMIYYGYANVVEKDRRYFKVELHSDVEKIGEYAEEYGIALRAAGILDMYFVNENKEEGIETGEIVAEYGKESYSLSTSDELKAYLNGSWRVIDKAPVGDARITLTVDGKYSVALYDEKTAKIVELNGQGEEKTPEYYSVSLNGTVEELYNYCIENGTVLETEK